MGNVSEGLELHIVIKARAIIETPIHRKASPQEQEGFFLVGLRLVGYDKSARRQTVVSDGVLFTLRRYFH